MKMITEANGPLIQHNVELIDYNTLRFGADAEHFSKPSTLRELRSLCEIASARQWPITIIGGGSNIIVPEQIAGLVVHPVLPQYWLEIHKQDALLHVESGVNWAKLVNEVTAAHWWGLENLAAIPGSAGAAPVQNIGAYGVELSELVEAVHVLDAKSGEYRILTPQECNFGYRNSLFKSQNASNFIIVRLVLRVSRNGKPKLDYPGLKNHLAMDANPAQVAETITQIRRQKLPDSRELPNVGSFFHNPIIALQQATRLQQLYPDMPTYAVKDGIKIPAAWLIQQCGFKGKREGAFGVYEKQALVIVHYGGGDAQTLLVFAHKIQQAVFDRFGLILTIEPVQIKKFA